MAISVIAISSVTAPCPQQPGSVTVSASGGIGPYLFEWFSDSLYTIPIGTGPTLTALFGTKFLKTTDLGNPSDIAFDTIGISATNYTGMAITGTVPPSVLGGSNGSLTVTIYFNPPPVGSNLPAQLVLNGGTPVIIPSGSSTPFVYTFTGLTAGAYTAVVTDGFGCVQSQSATITDPPAPVLVPIDPDLCFEDLTSNKLKITDFTGPYSADNTGGWGGSNPDLSTVLTATGTLVLSDGTKYENIDLLSDDFPSDTFQSITLDETHFPNGLVDGTATFTVNYTGISNGQPWVVEKSFTLFITATARCCVAKLASNVTSWENCCENTASKAFGKASTMLLDIKYLANECCQFDKATTVLTQLQAFCRSNNCTTC